MASVVLCDDERLGRSVAVKRLHADSPGEMEQRFAREARLGASLNHPNLVAIYDTAVDDEGVLIVMEYVEGESLSQALRRGPLEPGRVARMASELGGALDHAHAQGVVHRDVKPGNVLLREDGATKLADLGIATAADQTRITRSGIVLGSVAYMAPEQLDGAQAGPAADVYALAAVCFEALAGRRARSGRTPMEIAGAIATQPPPDLRDHLQEAPAAAADVLRRGLERDPRERPASAGELGSELRRALERPAEPTVATRPIRTPPAAPPASRRSRPAPAAAAPAHPAVAGARARQRHRGRGRRDRRPACGGWGRRRRGTPRAGAGTSEQRAEQPQAAPEEAEPAPAEPEAPDTSAASGPELNAQGFELMQAGPLRGGGAGAPAGGGDLARGQSRHRVRLRALQPRQVAHGGRRPGGGDPLPGEAAHLRDQQKTVEKELKRALKAAGRP